MPYLRISDDADDHPKLVPLSDGAFRLWFNVNCWCQRHETDGRIADSVLRERPKFTVTRRRELITAGLWRENQGAIVVHDFLVHNDSHELIEERRRAKAARMARWKERRRDALKDAPIDVTVDASTDASVDDPKDAPPHLTSPHLTSVDTKNVSTQTLATYGFDVFWDAYPRKVAKPHALKAWKAQRPPLDAVLAAIAATEWSPEPRFRPHPATWLNARRWEDQPERGSLSPVTPAEYARAEKFRQSAWGRCPHEPKCEVYADCINALAIEARTKQGAA